MKTKATRKLKVRIRGGGDNPNHNYAVFREQDLKDYIIKGTNSPNAPYISDEDAVRLKAELPNKFQFIDDMLRAQAEKQKKEQEELIAETQKKDEAARKNLDESVGTCTSYVQTTGKADCEENRGTYDQDNSCHYTPVNVKSQSECAAMQTRASIQNKVYHQFQEKDQSKDPVIYRESFLDSFEWDRNDKDAFVFFLEKVKLRLREINEQKTKSFNVRNPENMGILETEEKDIYSKLYKILAESIRYYLNSQDYEVILVILEKCPRNVVDVLGIIPETMLLKWVAEFKNTPEDQQKAFLRVKNDVKYFNSFVTWLDTNKYPELRKRILAEGLRVLQQGYVKGGRSSYTKLRRRSRRRKDRSSARKSNKW